MTALENALPPYKICQTKPDYIILQKHTKMNIPTRFKFYSTVIINLIVLPMTFRDSELPPTKNFHKYFTTMEPFARTQQCSSTIKTINTIIQSQNPEIRPPTLVILQKYSKKYIQINLEQILSI